MDLIDSFEVDHTRLMPGLYVSRVDRFGDSAITTFDLRLSRPNREPVLDVPAAHTIEHLGATYLRNVSDISDKVIYFGPMGCRTGFYLVVIGDMSPEDVYDSVIGMCDFIVGYEGDVPGAMPEQCGNYLSHDLPMAKYYANRYREELSKNRRFDYPNNDS